jgi:uncharacterized protein (TIGR03790 family)
MSKLSSSFRLTFDRNWSSPVRSIKQPCKATGIHLAAIMRLMQSLLVRFLRGIGLVVGLAAGLLGTSPVAVSAQSGANVLIVANEASPDSVQIALRYAQVRSLPSENVLLLKTLPADVSEAISRIGYEIQIERPIAEWFGRHNAYDRVLYIVLTKGIPLRIDGSGGRKGTRASVDSELTLLYRSLTGRAIAPHGPIQNPYFAGTRSSAQIDPFSHRDHDIFLVTRLDGFTREDVFGLIDRASSPVRHGRVLLDQKAALDDPANAWLKLAADRLTQSGYADRVVLETTSKILTNQPEVLGYFSWASSDPGIKTRRLGLGFVPGALAATFVSDDARTLREPPSEWTPGNWADRTTYFAGSPESLIGDLVREGATGLAGQVAEPYLDAAIRPDMLFPGYLSGLNLAEAFYSAMPYLSWQSVIIGDPLCSPFDQARSRLNQVEQIDPETELPGFFAERKLEFLTSKALKRDALKMLLRGEARLGRGDQGGAREALEAATAAEERLNQAHLLLAGLHEVSGEYDRAIDRYRRALANAPRDPVILNNLAYALAVHKQQPGDALPIAERAHLLAATNPAITDTLAWVHHLLGNRVEALRLLAQAIKAAPASPIIRLHAAAAYAATGQFEAAERDLALAVKLLPEMEQRPDVRELRAKIDEGKK